jgi:hypothetical protein
MKTGGFSVLFAIGLFAWATQAHADDVNGAAKAFSQAQEAQLGGDTARAADLYELADELAPSAPALRNATRARLAAGHLAMAATNAAALLRRYPGDKESREIAEAILSKLSPQLAHLDVACTAPCTLLVDGKVVASAARDQHSMFLQPGGRTITAAFADGGRAQNQVTAVAGQATSVRLEAPVAAPAPGAGATAASIAGPSPGSASADQMQRRGGISPWWVAGGGVVTAGLSVGLVVSGMATRSTRDKIRMSVAAGERADATDLYNTGRDQQTRTFLGATIAAGAGTVVLALFADWSGRERTREVAAVPMTDGFAVVYGGAF